MFDIGSSFRTPAMLLILLSVVAGAAPAEAARWVKGYVNANACRLPQYGCTFDCKSVCRERPNTTYDGQYVCGVTLGGGIGWVTGTFDSRFSDPPTNFCKVDLQCDGKRECTFAHLSRYWCLCH
jgi:hypothetical protein